MTGAHASRPLARRSAVGWGAVALGLVTIVALAAHGSAWSEHRGGELRSLPHAVTFAGVVVACGLAMVLFLLVLVRFGAPETAEQRRRRWSTAIGFLVLVAVLSVVRLLVHPSDRTASRDSPAAPEAGQPTPRSTGGDDSAATTWWPLVIVGLGTALAVVAGTARRGTRTPDDDTDDATIALLDASLDDLRREPDARRAVIAAYARMEGGLAAHGFARQPSETPTEYLRRALTADVGGRLTVRPRAVRPLAVHALGELTALAERARFSMLPIDETMRARAIEALEELQSELRREVDANLDRVG